jgi:hypothetical protein
MYSWVAAAVVIKPCQRHPDSATTAAATDAPQWHVLHGLRPELTWFGHALYNMQRCICRSRT